MGFMDSVKNCWSSFYNCMCPCCRKADGEKSEKVPLKSVWEDWEAERNWEYFTPHPGDPKWDKLPDSIKETVKRTSEELQRYATGRKLSFTEREERTHLLKK